MNARRAHDVRQLRACTYCKGLALPSRLFTLADGLAHPACFIETWGEERILDLPKEERLKVRLSDVSVEMMRKLIAAAGP